MNTHSVPSLLLYKQESLPRNTHTKPQTTALGPRWFCAFHASTMPSQGDEKLLWAGRTRTYVVLSGNRQARVLGTSATLALLTWPKLLLCLGLCFLL